MKALTKLLLVSILPFDIASAADSDIFNYDPNSPKGPEFWKDIVLENNQCGGTSNSPIALESMPCTMFEDYKFESGTCRYSDYGFDINDHVSQAYRPVNASCTPATMQVPGVDGVFELLQFHLHMNSEHTMDGGRYGAELHIVHQLKGSDPARLAVLGIFIEASSFEDERKFDNILSGFDAVADRTALACNMSAPIHWWSSENRTVIGSPNSQLQIYDLIPEGSTFYNYDGGLTTPPCLEIVEWNVASKPLSISIAQYNDLSGLVLNYIEPETCQYDTIASPSGSTSRPVQDRNAREINHICPKGYTDPLAGGSGGTPTNATSAAPSLETVGASKSAAVLAGILAVATSAASAL